MKIKGLVRVAYPVVCSDGALLRIDEFYTEGFTADCPITQWGRDSAGIGKLACAI